MAAIKNAISPGIYAILDGSEAESLWQHGQHLLELPISALQIRAKSLNLGDRAQLARGLKDIWDRLPPPTRPRFIINDDVTLARELACDLHLGQGDLPLPEARRQLPEAMIGISTHSWQQLQVATADGADYVGYGPLWPTTSKASALAPRTAAERRRLIAEARVPVVAIGGLTAEAVEALLPEGFRIFAMIAALADATFVERDLGPLVERIPRL